MNGKYTMNYRTPIKCLENNISEKNLINRKRFQTCYLKFKDLGNSDDLIIKLEY